MPFDIRQTGDRQFRIFEVGTTEYACKGRFHTREQAQECVDTQEAKALLATINPPSGVPSRARAYLITDPDYAGTHENLILRVARSLLIGPPG